jgi:CAAX protease family protein
LRAIVAAAGMEGLGILGPRLVVAAGADELLALFTFQALGIGLVVAASGLLGGDPRDVLALRGPAGGLRTYAVAAAAMILLPILVGVLFLVFALSVGGFDPSASGFDPTVDWQRDQGLVRSANPVLLAGVLAIGAPLSEELLYRGFLLSALARTRLGFWGAALIATALWAALHDYSAVGFAAVFMMGLLISWLLWRTGSLRVAIFCHALHNSLALVAHRLIPLAVPQ